MVSIDENVGQSSTAQDQESVNFPEPVDEKKNHALNLLSDGKRDLLALSLRNAQEKLSQACELYTEIFPEFAPECFEPYFYYGRSLLELCRLEPDVITNALQGVDVADDEKEGKDKEKNEEEEKKLEEQFENADILTADEREEIHDQVEDAFVENAELLEKGEIPLEDPASVSQVEENEQQDEEVQDEDVDDEQCEDIEEDQQLNMCQNEEKNYQEEDISHLQLAWEVLEIARTVCDRQNKTDEWLQRKAEVLLLLGDVSIEDDSYKQAVDDLTLCLEIQQKLFPANDRRIAESFFQMGRAYKLANDFESAAEKFQRAFDVLEKLAEETEQKLSSTEDPDSKSTLGKELNQLQGVLPDLRQAIDDALESAKNAANVLLEKEHEEKLNELEQEDRGGGNVTDISNLVRKPIKRNGRAKDFPDIPEEPTKMPKFADQEEDDDEW